MVGVQDAPASAHVSGIGDRLIEAVYAVILIVTIGSWTIVGFAVWVPLVVRTTTLLAAAVFYATLFRDSARITNAERSLHFAVRFYVKGFDHFITFYRQRHAPVPSIGLLEPLSDMKWRELIVECMWVLGVWALLYFGTSTVINSVV